MTALSAILRPVGFIFDPVPRVDRKPRPMDVSRYASEIAGAPPVTTYLSDDPLDQVSWDGIIKTRNDHPRSSPCPTRPYDWATRHAWPVDGWVLT